MTGIILEHAETGPAARLGAWATSRGLDFTVHRSWEDSPAAIDLTGVSWLASLGSAASVNATDPAWVGEEVALLRRAVSAGIPVLGLCWGGQALARALGGTVGPAPFAEKAWISIDSRDPTIPAGPWLHYHTEVFTIPAGAVEVARSPAGPAAFRIGPHLGLQFHPEADAEIAHVWAAKDPDQTEATIAALDAEGARFSPPAAQLADALFDAWWARLTPRAVTPSGAAAPARS